jgi:hypothetical protein
MNSGLMLGIAVVGSFLSRPAAAQDPVASPSNAYRGICGDEQILQNPATIPWIGCFYLSEGRSAAGTFLNQHVEIAVDSAGHEVFTVDGTVVTKAVDPQQTNLPFVRVGASGYVFCRNEPSDPCPTHIDVFSRNPDKSILFVVSECLPPRNREHICALSQKNWDFEKSRQASNQGQQPPLLKDQNVPLPEGPFSSWPADSREPALQTLRSRCLFLAGMLLAGGNAPQVPRETLGNAALALISGCVANAMPEDWPQRGAELDREKMYEQKAKPFMPSSFDFAATVNNIAQAMKRRAP